MVSFSLGILIDAPTYVKASPVSAKQMVSAIESSRQEAARRPMSGSPHVSLTSGIALEAIPGSDPFSKAADPFANQLEAAIEASLRKPNAQRDHAKTPEPEIVQLPDVQAQYLVGPAKWESVNAKDIKIRNVTPSNRPKVAALEHGLDRVLFNPGVHWLQDPRSSVFNFDPYLRSICQPSEFDYDALPAYKTSSMDPALFNVAHMHRGKYMGSTSSMTSILSQFYFLISGWKPLKTNHLSEAFSSQGKSMEKMLTSTPDEFARFTKKNSWQVTSKEREMPEAFNYIAVDKFLLRSQLDCEDPRLPGKTFDLKTRAAVAIRLDVHNYELNQGYQLRKAHGYLESFEREYYDMMRSAFLKYSLQVRIGQMDGIFVAFHNTARVFGFQYISLDEMDSRLFGTSVMGDECFKNQLRLLNRSLDEITAKYPKQDLKITVDTDETVQSMNIWVETMPLGSASSPQGRDVKVVLDENGAPEMQPGAELSLWQVVCYSNINNVPTVGPFELNERATDEWELRYKIGELRKPHMMNEYRRMKAIQAEILSDDEEREAAMAAAAAATAASAGLQTESTKSRREIQTAARAQSRRDSMRTTLRRISEQGRIKQEDEERRQADKEFLIWEPKGYTKITEQTAVIGTQIEPTEDVKPTMHRAAKQKIPSSSTPVLPLQEESIASKMVQRLKEAATKAASANAGTISKQDVNGSPLATSSAGISSVPATYYRRSYDGKVIKLALNDLELIRKSLTTNLTESGEVAQLNHLKEHHEWLVSNLTPFDDVRFKMLEVPVKAIEYEKLDRQHLNKIAGLMGEPNSIISPRISDNTLRRLLHQKSPEFRRKLNLEFYHAWIHKLVAMSDGARPFKSVDEFLLVNDEAALMRVAHTLGVTDKMIQNQAFVQGLQQSDATKKAVLTQIFYAEQSFQDEELKAMGFFPRIFDPTVVRTTRDILKGIGTKYQEVNKG
ncbi:hypothetical protein BGZ99_004886 [Dissophora globulifera]|uniref:Pet127-domain-containing protein n=1 Tax=Dissophora globulifera TaxID=979702 RepID=A0A9P6UU78_9FUNG|nr:hypothetical protein BGZ99_004886 [Dissophora globulifera]